MARDLTDRPIIITGASSGIGAATALACAQAGMDVVLNARRADRLEAVAERVREIGRRAETVVGDVTNDGLAEELIETCERAFGRVDVVFANAGYGLELTSLETSMEQMRAIFDVNFFASVDLLQRAAGRLIEQQQGGHLLMCSSCLAKFTLEKYSAYSATKAAQNHICRAMNLELRFANIPVSSVHPITTTTEFHETVARLSDDDATPPSTPDHAVGMFVQPPERVARAIVRCLRKPKPEVWTSFVVRATAAFGTLLPRFMDLAVRGR